MKKILTKFTLIMLGLVLCTCDNFFHDLIPESGNRITSFYLDGQMHSEIGENEIVVTVMPGTSFDGVTPRIQVSPGATLFPITYDYISRSFNDERTFGAAMQIYAGGNMTENVIEMLRGNKSFIRPVTDIPIDFSYPVDFLVVSGQGSVRKYTVKVVVDTGEGKFTSFRFDKFYNPELVRTATGVIDNINRIVTVTVSYPVENIANYKLIPLFETNNARVYFDNGREIINAQEIFDYLKPPDSSDLLNPVYGTQEKTLTLKRTGYPDCEWKLIVNFEEDPDTSRSIIDFRFTKSKNSSLNADYMAEIINTGNTGTINVTVYYSGAQPPAELRADFISPAQLPPGSITVNGQNQTSGISYQDFSSPLQYIVTSRSGSYTRTYTVNVSMVSASDPLPQITSFAFDTAKNPLLKSNSSAVIDHNACVIIIEAAYEGGNVPVNLVPQFTATGNVTVNGTAQTSGVSSNNFSGFVFYTVTNPSNPTLKREYKVQVVFVEALSSVAEITAFYFTKADNPELLADVTASINQITGEITAVLLFETPNGGNRSLIARWSAQGNVYLGNTVQTSGLNSRQFYSPSAYRAVSFDNLRQKNYTVKIKEVNTRIYVRQNATGRNDGTNWQNAYTNLPVACDDAGLFPDAISKELWIAKGTYSSTDYNNINDYLQVTANTSYIGGFAGNETSITERINPQINRPEISGNLQEEKKSRKIFEYRRTAKSSELFHFEDLIFSNAGDGQADNDGPLIEISNYSTNDMPNGPIPFTITVIIKGVDFLNSYGSRGGALSIWGDNITLVENCNFSNTKSSRLGGAVWIHRGTSINFRNCNFINTRSDDNYGNVFWFSTCNTPTLTNVNYNGIPNPVFSQ